MINLKSYPTGDFVIDVAEWNELKKCQNAFHANKTDVPTQARMHAAFVDFLGWLSAIAKKQETGGQVPVSDKMEYVISS